MLAPFSHVFFVKAHKHIPREQKSTDFNEFVVSA